MIRITLYLLKDQMESAGSPCDIVKYNLVTKTFQLIKMPNEKIAAFDYFTISPNEQVEIFQCGTLLYVIDLTKNSIIDKIGVPSGGFQSN